jgi:hypothetical protein
MNVRVLFLTLLGICGNVVAQQWAPVGQLNNGVNCLFEDNEQSILYIGGTFGLFNSDTMASIFSWNGQRGSRLDCGMEWDCSENFYVSATPAVNQIIRYQNDIYATGFFWYASGTRVNGLARWDGENWHAVGTGLKYGNRPGLGPGPGPGYGLKVINDELFVMGRFDSCAGVAANSIAKFNGINWSAVDEFPLFDPDTPNSISEVAFFKSELYVGGNFSETGDLMGYKSSIVRYSNGEWVSVGKGIRGGFSGIDCMEIYKGELYVGGLFQRLGTLNPGHGIAKWNGTSWSEIGGSGLGNEGLPHIFDMIVFQDKLYIVGDMRTAGGVPVKSIARWDGTNWCALSPPGTFPNTIIALGSYRDTLYIGGGFRHVGGDSNMAYIAKWIGGDYTENCGNTTGIENQAVEEIIMSAYPNPVSDQLTISLGTDEKGDLSIIDITGRISYQQQFAKHHPTNISIPLNDWSNGIYLVRWQDEQNSRSIKFVKQ